MTGYSEYLEALIAQKDNACDMQVVFVDIVAYSKRKTSVQYGVINSFMDTLQESITKTIKYFQQHGQIKNIEFIKLPSGDGAAIGIPYAGKYHIHLVFAKELIKDIHAKNTTANCPTFNKQGWCNCHHTFNLRIGISIGKLIVYKDLNNNYNMAGRVINMAARVMNLAKSNQIVLTDNAYDEICDLSGIHHIEHNFIRYDQVKVKHGVNITTYQYIDDDLTGLNSNPIENLNIQESIIENKESGITESANNKDDIIQSLLDEMKERMVEIPPGKFIMGDDKTSRFEVVFDKPFLMDKFPVTQSIYLKVMNNNPSHFIGENHPVDNISWYDAIEFCNLLSKLSGLDQIYENIGKNILIHYDKNGYRLPTETQWEYACRAHTTNDRYGELHSIAWYSDNSGRQTHEVGLKEPNEFGLYDMLGNVWEWCNDWYENKYSINLIGPDNGIEKVLRGGSWADISKTNRITYRFRKDPSFLDDNFGFRLVLPFEG